MTPAVHDLLTTILPCFAMLNSLILDQLKDIFGSKNVLCSRIAVESYSYDSSPFFGSPEAVVFTKSTEQVRKLFLLAGKENLAITPRGAGTNVSGGCIPEHGGVILAMNKMNRILDIDPANETALVEPGVTNMALQKAAAPYNLMFAPDPGSLRVATIGGNVAECAGGMRGVKYGTTKDHLLGLEVVLPDGTVDYLGGRNPFTPQPDLSGIFCGSEGTFGVITKILVKLVPVPEAVRTLLVFFDDLGKAGTAVSEIMKSGPPPTALELMDQAMMRAIDDFLRIGFPLDTEAALLIEIDGIEQELDRWANTIRSICNLCGAIDIQLARNDHERQELWRARRSGNGAMGRIKPAYMVQDVTVPCNEIPDMLRLIADVAEEYGITIAQLAHAGDGNLHPHLLYDPENHEEMERVEQAAKRIFLAALDVGGTLTGEHGIGLEKRSYMERAFTTEDMRFMLDIKAAMDPRHILNKGKIFPNIAQ